VSKSLAAELKRRYPKQADKIEYIPNGVSTYADDPAADWDLDRRFGLEKGKYILGVGRLVPEKGFHELIGAFRLAKTNGMKLVIAGKADHEDRYSRALLREACDRIVFTGFQDAATLRQLYAHAALFVLPSQHEGLPIAALEAASHGIPVLLSDIPANRDLGLPDAHYFPVSDVGALSDRLIADFETMRADPAWISGAFDWDRIAQATATVYSRAA
jgi:glycosyltransferase involved in cell wall biosynthesis